MKYLKLMSWKRLLLFALIFASGAVFAQPPQGKLNPEQRAQKMTEKMTESLKLNEKQANAVSEINNRFAKQVSEIWQNKELTQPDKKAKMQALKAQKEKELQSALTKEQFDRFNQIKAENHNRMKGKMKEHGNKKMANPEERAKHQTERLQNHLNLSPQQAEKANQINLKYAKEAEVLHQEREAARTEMQNKHRTMRETHRQEIRNILTEEQKNLYDQKKQEMKEKHKNGKQPRMW
ncbi:MAG: hypothetical protein IPM47_20765 [Sphingobacteriales bacterium]|nr:MAG: hypothetical protein IPM47_20765 [Sphingobacteriales bacterium]